MHKLWRRLSSACMIIMALGGCAGPDQRLADFAQVANQQQAEQNQQAAELQQTVAEAHRELLEAEAASRAEWSALQQDLRDDQALVAQQRDALELERQTIARERREDSATAGALVTVGLIIACLAPLFVAGAALVGLFTEPRQGETSLVLVEELVGRSPLGLAGPSAAPALPDATVPRSSS